MMAGVVVGVVVLPGGCLPPPVCVEHFLTMIRLELLVQGVQEDVAFAHPSCITNSVLSMCHQSIE